MAAKLLRNYNIYNKDTINKVDEATFNYIISLIEPYIDAIKDATNREQVISWSKQVFSPEYSNQLNEKIATQKIDYIPMILGQFLVDVLTEEAMNGDNPLVPELITPWDLEERRSPEAIKLFGEPVANAKLPVSVTINGNTYYHDMTKELVHGILIVSDDYNNVTLKFQGDELLLRTFGLGVPLILIRDVNYGGQRMVKYYSYYSYYVDIDERVLYRHMNTDDMREYYNDKIKRFYFNTPEFIQGIVTGAEWVGRNPREYIYYFNDNRTGEMLQYV